MNDKGYYLHDYCKSTGLPMMTLDEAYTLGYWSRSKCKEWGHPVQDGEKVAAFGRVWLANGYCGLYDRREFKDQAKGR